MLNGRIFPQLGQTPENIILSAVALNMGANFFEKWNATLNVSNFTPF